MTDSSRTMVRIGVARRSATPPGTVDLYNLDGVRRTSARVLDDLHVSAVALECRGREVLILSVDMIWMTRELVDGLRAFAQAGRGLAPADVLVCATHAHSTPQLKADINNPGRPDPGYAAFLAQRMQEAAQAAWEDMGPGRMELARGPSGAVVHRRKRILDLEALKRFRLRGKMANRPAFGKPCDDVLSEVRLLAADGRIKGSLVNLGCHPTLFRGDALSADYPGRLARLLEQERGAGHVTCFLQGFSGDVKARIVQRNRAPLSSPLKWLYYRFLDPWGFVKTLGEADMEAFAARLAERLRGLRAEPLAPGALGGAETEVLLPLSPAPPRERFEALAAEGGPVHGAYGRAMLERLGRFTHQPMRIQRLTLARGLELVAMEGEIFCEYALWLRRALAGKGVHLLSVGCAGGMAGYIPDARGVAQGGYEVQRCLVEFGLPAPFSPELEARIRGKVAELFGGDGLD